MESFLARGGHTGVAQTTTVCRRRSAVGIRVQLLTTAEQVQARHVLRDDRRWIRKDFAATEGDTGAG